ncbi:MAG: ATP-dependent 6-phosphofructokinase [Oscillospiraceae bacterium]|nr:ATP-dependent 6-phosphofructokinase [Oscillospiraceae bacterium]
MAKKIKIIGVLTSGGDAPGMNAAIRAVVRTAYAHDIKVLGIMSGYQGLIEGKMKELNIRSVAKIIDKPGTELYSARCEEFRHEPGIQRAVDVCKEYQIDGIIGIGGDGTFRGLQDLSRHGISCIGLPGTIDNDISCTDYTIGYDTALNTVVNAVDCLRATSESHKRCSVLEIMGNTAGDLTLYGGIATGATAIVLPEREFDFQKDIIDRIVSARNAGKVHFIVLVAEGAFKDNRAKGSKAYLPQDGIADVHQLAKCIGCSTQELISANGKQGFAACIKLCPRTGADCPNSANLVPGLGDDAAAAADAAAKEKAPAIAQKKAISEADAYQKLYWEELFNIFKNDDQYTYIPGVETRGNVLGHIQRGGIPTYKDRYVASKMGEYAVNIIAEGATNRVVAIKNDKYVDYDIQEALKQPKSFELGDYETAMILSV